MNQPVPRPRNHATESPQASPTPVDDAAELGLVTYESTEQLALLSTWSSPESNPRGILSSNSKRKGEAQTERTPIREKQSRAASRTWSAKGDDRLSFFRYRANPRSNDRFQKRSIANRNSKKLRLQSSCRAGSPPCWQIALQDRRVHLSHMYVGAFALSSYAAFAFLSDSASISSFNRFITSCCARSADFPPDFQLSYPSHLNTSPSPSKRDHVVRGLI
jgi:hypothetical protein